MMDCRCPLWSLEFYSLKFKQKGNNIQLLSVLKEEMENINLLSVMTVPYLLLQVNGIILTVKKTVIESIDL